MTKVKELENEDGTTSHGMMLICDGCGEEFCDSDGNSVWSCENEDDAKNHIAYYVRDDIGYHEADWNYEDGDKDYCPLCAHYSYDYLDRIVVHPIPASIKEVVETNAKFRDETTEIGSGPITIPRELARKIKRMMNDYGRILCRCHKLYGEVNAHIDDFKKDKDTYEYFSSYSTEEHLKSKLDMMKEIMGKYYEDK